MRGVSASFVIFTSMLAAWVSCLAGCEIGYYSHLVTGELAILASTIPVQQALEDSSLTDDERAKLALTQEVRRFGIERIGLFAGDAYTVFEANGSEPAAHVLSASAKDSLTSFRWNLLFVGVVETKGFLDEAMGRWEADLLLALGFDVFYGGADGFSTLGFLPDPVRQSNLRMDDIDLADLILHEMTHSTIFKPSDINFNESLATFVGRAAAQAWFDEDCGVDSPEALAAGVRFADKAIVDEYVNELFAEMSDYYRDAAAQGETPEEIIAGRQAHFDAATERFRTQYQPRLGDPDRWQGVGEIVWDNARLLAAIRYQGTLSDYQAVLDKAGGSFPDALAI